MSGRVMGMSEDERDRSLAWLSWAAGLGWAPTAFPPEFPALQRLRRAAEENDRMCVR